MEREAEFLCSQLPEKHSGLLLTLWDGGEGPSFFKMPRRLANPIRWEMALKTMRCPCSKVPILSLLPPVITHTGPTECQVRGRWINLKTWIPVLCL